MSDTDNFKSIDEYVECYRLDSPNGIAYLYKNMHIIRDILISKTNKPSKWDIFIINEINKSRNTPSASSWEALTDAILEIYKNRKD